MMFTFKAVITCVFLTVFCSLINPETEALLFSPSVGQQPLQKENLLQFLHSYFDNTNLDKYPTKMGSYRRDNPEPWSSNTYLNPESTILVLGEKIKLSHGPRKKRSQDYFLRHFYRKNDFRSEPQLEKLNNFVADMCVLVCILVFDISEFFIFVADICVRFCILFPFSEFCNFVVDMCVCVFSALLLSIF